MNTEKRSLTVATRKSPLALAQAALVRSALESRNPDIDIEILEMTTTGDRKLEWSLEEKAGKGLFTKELETALLDGSADCAVHSAKDLPTQLPAGLGIAGFLTRESAHDVLVVRDGCVIPENIASGSPRRLAQGRLLFPRAQWCGIRGNVETRLDKVARGEADATILAVAGIKRLGISSWPGVVFRPLPLRQMVPAAGQGAIALECRDDGGGVFTGIFDAATGRAVTIERLFLDRVGGGCDSSQAGHFCNNELLVFHDGCGFRSFSFDGCPDSDLATRVDKIVDTLGIT